MSKKIVFRLSVWVLLGILCYSNSYSQTCKITYPAGLHLIDSDPFGTGCEFRTGIEIIPENCTVAIGVVKPLSSSSVCSAHCVWKDTSQGILGEFFCDNDGNVRFKGFIQFAAEVKRKCSRWYTSSAYNAFVTSLNFIYVEEICNEAVDCKDTTPIYANLPNAGDDQIHTGDDEVIICCN